MTSNGSTKKVQRRALTHFQYHQLYLLAERDKGLLTNFFVSDLAERYSKEMDVEVSSPSVATVLKELGLKAKGSHALTTVYKKEKTKELEKRIETLEWALISLYNTMGEPVPEDLRS